jgi:hypothetical protein
MVFAPPSYKLIFNRLSHSSFIYRYIAAFTKGSDFVFQLIFLRNAEAGVGN